MATAMAQKSFVGQRFSALPMRNARAARTAVKPVANAKVPKTDIKKVGLESIDNEVVQRNLKGQSKYMDKKGWVDAQGRKGKGYGVYRFADKYGANVDGYSPIYTPDLWSDTGDTYKLGTKGLLAWAGLVVVLLGIGVTLIVSTSQIGS